MRFSKYVLPKNHAMFESYIIISNYIRWLIIHYSRFDTKAPLDGVALNLHSFYSGIERIFELIAANVDDIRPVGENWHQTLLK